MKGLTLEKIEKAVKGKLYHASEAKTDQIQGVVIDSREVKEGYLFVAVKGQRVDGHSFIPTVFSQGAACALVETKPESDVPYILVDSTLQALKDLAAFYREQLDIPVIGITGSVGKTSTKEFIASVLSEKFQVLKTQGNFNNEIGVPLTLLRIRDEHQAAVVEMGISDFGEMHRLSYMVKPDICVMTNIGLCHLENLKTRDGILKAKSEIFDFAAEDCKAVLNGDDDKLSTIHEVHGRKPLFYGMADTNDLYAKEIRTKGVYGTEAVLKMENGEEIKVSFQLPGKHMVYNALAAAGVGRILGLSADEIQRGIEKIQSVGGRLHILEANDMTIIDDCYNANPVSVKASLDVLNEAEGRKVAILGDMFELGQNEKQLHYEVGTYFKEKQIDVALFAGTLSECTYQGVMESKSATECYYYQTAEDLLMFLDLMVKPKDTVLVKASHSMHFEQIVEQLKKEKED